MDEKNVLTLPLKCELKRFLTKEGDEREYIAYTATIDGNIVAFQAKDEYKRLASYLLKEKLKNQEGVNK